MKIEIQAYWDAKVSSAKHVPTTTPEEYLKKNPEIRVCDVVIDGKVVGTVAWNGEKLSIFEWGE